MQRDPLRLRVIPGDRARLPSLLELQPDPRQRRRTRRREIAAIVIVALIAAGSLGLVWLVGR